MASDSSFDVVSRVNMAEVVNSVHQTMKEIETRFDFKGSKSDVTLDEKAGEITVLADDDMKRRNIDDILRTRLAKRGVALRALQYADPEEASGGALRQVITLQQGIPAEKAKEITKAIRDSKLKVKAEIQGEQVRVSAPKKDDLQAVIQLLKGKDFGVELQFVNYR